MQIETILHKTTTIKMNVAKISAAVLQFLNKNVHGKLSNLRTQIKVGRFWKLALVFFNSRVINMLFLFTSLIKLPSRRVFFENKHNYGSGEALPWSTVKFSELMVKKICSS